MSHSGSSLEGAGAQGLVACPHAFEPTGFGYLLGPPEPEQRSRLGNDPAEAHRLLSALARALPAPAGYWQKPLRPGTDLDDNPFIPSGYTYLLQLVAHDAVQTSVPFWAAAQLGLGSRNLRSSPLILDTLYGGGPNAAAVAYRTSGNSAGDRTRLRVGRFPSMKTGRAADMGQCSFRDLARINLWPPREMAVQTANFDEAFVTCIADSRNDDNLILAQLVVLFANLHNAIASRLTNARPEAVFGYSQVTMQHIYHAVIERDLMPRLLHPDVMAALRGRSAGDERWLWRTDSVPREFTHGAFRAGHAMVRKDYRFNASSEFGVLPIKLTMTGGTRWAETRSPLRETWIIDWSLFFDLSPGSATNLSRRFSPCRSVLDTAGLFRSADKEQPESLSLRDMLSAAVSGAWSVDALLDKIMARPDNPLPSAWAWRDPATRRAAIHDWLSTHCAKLGAADIDTIAGDPPLPLFVLLEAALDPQVAGRHLGPLGSTIVGEVIGRSIARQRQALGTAENAAKAAFGADLWNEMMAVTSMPELIEFARRHGACVSAPF